MSPRRTNAKHSASHTPIVPVASIGELAEAAESMHRQFSADEYPHIAETITQHVTKSGYDFADEFEFGLDLILDGLERFRGAA